MSTAEQKASELINMYYGYREQTQKQAIEEVERVVLTRLCQEIDDMHIHVVLRGDYDPNLVKPRIQKLKFWQEVGAALQNFKNKIPV